MAKVLVVDDTLFMRTALSKMLQEWGLEVVAQAANVVRRLTCIKNIHLT